MTSRAEEVAAIIGEWRRRRDAGEDVSPEVLIRQHAHLAGELRDQFAVIRAVDRAAVEAFDLPAGAPRQVGEYRILREIGRGGMGFVYEAEQESLRRRVALKILHPAITSTAQARKRFEQEARAAGKLHHTNIVPVYGMGTDGGISYYAMELVQGHALSDVIARMRGRRPTEERLARAAQSASESAGGAASGLGTTTGDRSYFVRVAELFAGVADALELAHSQGVIHRDIKPSNLLLTAEGLLKVMDFGLARVEGEGASLTMTGDLVGTPAYMSPEQAMAKRVAIDHRTDIYSLGATLYEVLALRPPFESDSLQHLCSQILSKDPLLPRRRNRKIPRDMETIVCKAMEKDRDRRYQSAAAFARDLRAFAGGVAIRARRIGPAGRTWRQVKRHKVRSSLATATLVAGTIAVLFAWRSARDAAERRDLEYVMLCGQAQAALLRPTTGSTESAAVVPAGETATEILTRAISLRPDRPEAYFWRAGIAGRGLADQLDDIAAAQRSGLPRRIVHLARANVLHHAQRWEEAKEERKLAGQFARAGPMDALCEGSILATEGQWSEAAELLTEAIVSSPQGGMHVMALQRRAFVRETLGDDEGALADLLAVREMGGANLAARLAIASIWGRLGRGKKAQALFETERSRAETDGSEGAWLALCDACWSARERSWHAEVTREAVAAHGDSPRLLIQLSVALGEEGRRAESFATAMRAAALAPDNADAHVRVGNILHGMGRREEALAAYERALRIDPRSARAHSGRGHQLFWLRRPEEALAASDRALELAPYDAVVHDVRAHALAALGREEDALAASDRSLELAPRDARIHSDRAGLLVQIHRGAEGLKAAERALELEPGLGMAHMNRAGALAALGRYQESLAACDTALSDDSGIAMAHACRAKSLLGLERPAEALEAAKRAIDIDPGTVQAHYYGTRALLALKEWQAALEAADRLLEIDRDPGNGHWFRGLALKRLNRFGEALEAFEQCIELGRASGNSTWLVKALLAHANLLWPVGRAQEALAETTEAVALAPDNVHALEIHAGALNNVGKYEEALDVCKRALALEPDRVVLHAYRAFALNRLGRPAEALAAADRAVTLGPRRSDAHYQRAIVLAELKRYDEALTAIDRAVELSGGFGMHLMTRGNVLERLGRHEEAAVAYGRAGGAGSRHGIAAQANLLRRMGRLEDALATCQQGLRAWPRFAQIHAERGHTLCVLGRVAEACDAWDAAVSLGLQDPMLLNNLAWARANSSDPEVRNVVRAVALARRAVELAPNEAWARCTLGAALYRAGDWRASLDALQESAALRSKPSAWDGFFLAMAHCKLGNADDAREWYNKAVASMDEQQAVDAELRRTRTEAKELLALGK